MRPILSSYDFSVMIELMLKELDQSDMDIQSHFGSQLNCDLPLSEVYMLHLV
jgi:hypothetical protein